MTSRRGKTSRSKLQRPLVGMHVSIADGIEKAPLRAKDAGAVCMQIFTQSNRQWAARPISDKSLDAWKRNLHETGIGPVISHNCYLINLGSPDRALARRSFDTFLLELQRCELLGIGAVIAHPGSHTGSGEAAGLRRIARAVNMLFNRTPKSSVRILLETTAGQGTSLGGRFEHLASMIDLIEDDARVGVCYDTCHTFAAGYDIRTEATYQKTMSEFDRIVGLGRIEVFHFNDAKTDLGSGVDRHEHIGRGKLGRDAFRFILTDPRFEDVPKILETPKGTHGRSTWDRTNLALLRRLARKG